MSSNPSLHSRHPFLLLDSNGDKWVRSFDILGCKGFEGCVLDFGFRRRLRLPRLPWVISCIPVTLFCFWIRMGANELGVLDLGFEGLDWVLVLVVDGLGF
ncbi:hypothetical protein KC19_VG106000 [Ceratodon purpureus]|uniref:Transmembrane protein n=1 Tax=Ceratodon purpureus TaxID=3225 RepID=A0A8T0HPM0_CERPU|nr:hypothetical protein KC19_VG106000 [Ceratodon purpureus]